MTGRSDLRADGDRLEGRAGDAAPVVIRDFLSGRDAPEIALVVDGPGERGLVQLFRDDVPSVVQLHRDIEARETAAALAPA